MDFVEVRSDGTGGFQLPSLAPGSCTVIASMEEREARSDPDLGRSRETVRLSITMQ